MIKIKHSQRTGQLSRELEKAKFQPDKEGKLCRLPAPGNTASKADQLKDAGISTSAAKCLGRWPLMVSSVLPEVPNVPSLPVIRLFQVFDTVLAGSYVPNCLELDPSGPGIDPADCWKSQPGWRVAHEICFTAMRRGPICFLQGNLNERLGRDLPDRIDVVLPH